MIGSGRLRHENAKNKISWHLKDLLRRDINVSYDCVQWLQPNQRDIDRRARPKRLAQRYVAASIIVASADNPAFARELLDRTEGKVADRLDVNEKRSINIRIELAPTHNQHTLPPDNSVTQALQVIEGMAVREQALDHVSSASGQGQGQGQATPVDPPGSHHGGSEE